MNKSRRFPGKFFKSLRDDPILDDSIGLIDDANPPSEDNRFATLASFFASPALDGDGSPGIESSSADAVVSGTPDSEAKKREYIVNSIFAPPDLREEADQAHQQLVFVREQEGVLIGLQEVNDLIHKGWRVVNAFATGNSAIYKALVLLER